MSKAQFGWLRSAVLAACGLVAAFGSSSFAQDASVAPSATMVTANPATPPQVVYSTENQVGYAAQYAVPQYTRSYCSGGPYKGFYPCNGKTLYFGGACNVYGDAPIYSAVADYGYHCAAHCP
jgi:hypothetical protein